MTGSAGRFTYAAGSCMNVQAWPCGLELCEYNIFYMNFLSLLLSFFHCGSIADHGRAVFEKTLISRTRMQTIDP